VALSWAWQLGIAAVTKTEKVARMQENLDIFNFSLSAEDIEAISHLNKNLRLFGNPARYP
jgi:diketogulonate reductase-like aldo/keto reductase